MVEATFEERRLNTVDRRAEVRNRLGVFQNRRALEIFAGGSFVEMVGGLAALGLACFGLAGMVPGILASVAGICISSALMLEGLAVSAEYGRLTGWQGAPPQVAGGMSAEFVAGGSGLALSILGLVGVYRPILLAITVIILGMGLAISSGAKMRLNSLRATETEGEIEESKLKKMVIAAIGLEVIVGVAAVVLGIIALSQIAPAEVVLVAFLILGVIMLASGSALGGKLMSTARSFS